jgi:hypothetical protein
MGRHRADHQTQATLLTAPASATIHFVARPEHSTTAETTPFVEEDFRMRRHRPSRHDVSRDGLSRQSPISQPGERRFLFLNLDYRSSRAGGMISLAVAVAIAILLVSPQGTNAAARGEDEGSPQQAEQPTEESATEAELTEAEHKKADEDTRSAAANDAADVKPGPEDDGEPVTRERLKRAIVGAIKPMEASAREYRDQRQCFSCHHQAVPILAFDLAQRLKFDVDAENLRQQVEHTKAHLQRGKEDYLAGKGQGGRADTAGWALWALEVAGEPIDEVTIPVANYLLEWQRDQGHWSPPSQRPPTESSPFTSTYVGLRGISYFLPEGHEEERDSRIGAVKAWLQDAPAADTEDRVYRLRSLSYLDDSSWKDSRNDTELSPSIVDAREQLLTLQRPDGGWGQTEEMSSDAYATATALAALAESGGLSTGSDPYQAGVRFLLKHQQPDGTWHVATRSKPVQVYFESGFPYGKDQFLSMAATAWSTYALLLALEDDDSSENDSPENDSSGGDPSQRR